MRNLKTMVFLVVLVFLVKVFIADRIGDNEKPERNLAHSRIPASISTPR